MTDRVIYETSGKPIYVIQFQTENGTWVDSYSPFRSEEAAINDLNTRTAAPYPYRIVERTK